MADTLKLKALIAGSGIARKEIAKQMGISYFSLAKKIANESEFKANEVVALSEILNIENKEEIFFTYK